jgi:hypothetical protein
MEPYYVVEQLVHDRLDDARACARAAALVEEHAPRRRCSYTLGQGLIRLGSWLARPPRAAGGADHRPGLARGASH